MSDLDDAMLQHIHFIVDTEKRPFSYRDFLKFDVGGQAYGMTHGTFRNKILKLRSLEKVELSYYSSCAFYTLKGHKFGKAMTPTHTVVHNDPVYRMLKDLPLDKQSIHDIRLRFEVPSIWKIFSTNSNFPRNKANEDITIPTWKKDNVMVRVFIHKTDVVSVMIAASLSPVTLDTNGIIRFFNTLVRIEEKLQNSVDNFPALLTEEKHNFIPDCSNWIITMWHFGRDSLVEYTGQKFSITVEHARHVLTRVYSKDFNGKQRIRIERQEYPRKTVTDLIDERLGANIHGL